MEIPEGAIIEREAQRTATSFPKSRKRSSGKRLVSEDTGARVKAYTEECNSKGIAQSSAEFQKGLSRIVNSDLRKETRVLCEIGVKRVRGYIYKPRGHESEPWWMHILICNHPGDALRGFTLYEMEQLINDLSANAGIHCTAIPKMKDKRVAALREMIKLAVKKNRDVAKCPHYRLIDYNLTWPENWCYNCPRDCLLDHCIGKKEVK